ncbi:MAG: transglutaminase-like domain-containing protein [Spirochaetales bacterium]|nr:transglutaminase-like domain-containing protein [Spirochaetales bacterium]
MMILLFRAALYFLTLLFLLIEPAVFVRFDAMGWGLYFVLIPLSAGMAFVRGKKKIYGEVFLLLLFIFSFTGLSREGLWVLGAGLYVFITTWLAKEREILFPLKGEVFFLAYIHYRMLLFLNSSPDSALDWTGFGSWLLLLLLLSFFLYSAVLYLWGSGNIKGRKGNMAFMGGLVFLVIILALLARADGFSHSIVPETANDPIRPKPELLDLTSNSPFNEGNLSGQGMGEQGQSSGEGQEGEEEGPKLLGIPGSSWSENSSQSGEDDQPRQYAVMVVESDRRATYMASRYYTSHKLDTGFMVNYDLYLNEIAHMRFVETWQNPHSPLYTAREAVSVSALSVDAEKGVPYFPYRVEPTVNNRSYYPFLYSWQSLSLVTADNRLNSLHSVRSYPSDLPPEVEEALELDLSDSMEVLLDRILESLGTENMRPYQTLQAILTMYSEYQYTLGFTEDWTTGHIMDFLVSGREGDCTEFSNGTALLARRAGIPTRVVTGYLASEDLQTPNHQRALYYLREQIPPLQEMDINKLFLVTSSHKHAWVQCWFPYYGWVDFETTAQAMPPSSGGDPNSLDVVIPIITETVKGRSAFIFPWRIVLRLLTVALLILLLIAYSAKIVYRVYLRRKGNIPGEEGYKALYRLMEFRWVDRGHPARDKQLTPREYGEKYPPVKAFSEIFILGVYGGTGKKETWESYCKAYGELFREDRSLLRGMREIVSLKGLYHGIQSR